METYLDRDNDSSVESYQIGDDYIIVKFKSGRTQYYKYTYASAGASSVEEMKQLAHAGDGLNSYIKRCNPGYVERW